MWPFLKVLSVIGDGHCTQRHVGHPVVRVAGVLPTRHEGCEIRTPSSSSYQSECLTPSRHQDAKQIYQLAQPILTFVSDQVHLLNQVLLSQL
jgi:hypothetical protein